MPSCLCALSQQQVKRVDKQKAAERMPVMKVDGAKAGAKTEWRSQIYPAISVPALTNGVGYARMDLQARADAVGESARRISPMLQCRAQAWACVES